MSTNILDTLADIVLGQSATELVPAVLGGLAGSLLFAAASGTQASNILEARRFTEPRFPKLTYALSEQPADRSFIRYINFHTPEIIPSIVQEKYPSGDLTEYFQRTKPLESKIESPPTERRVFLRQETELPIYIPEPIFFQLGKQVAENRFRSLNLGGELGDWYKVFGPFSIPSEDIVTVSYSDDPGVIAHELGHVRGEHDIGSWFYPTLASIQYGASILPFVAAAARALAPDADLRNITRVLLATAILSRIPWLIAYEVGEWDASLRGQAMLNRLQMQRGRDYYEKPSSGFWIRMSPTFPIVGFLIGRVIGHIMAHSGK